MLPLLVLWPHENDGETSLKERDRLEITGCVDAQKVISLEKRSIALELEKEELARNITHLELLQAAVNGLLSASKNQVETLKKRIAELERRDNDLSANLAEMARQVGTLHARNMALLTQNRDLERDLERDSGRLRQGPYAKFAAFASVLAVGAAALACWYRRAAQQRSAREVDLDVGAVAGLGEAQHRTGVEPPTTPGTGEPASLPLLGADCSPDGSASPGHTGGSAVVTPSKSDVTLNVTDRTLHPVSPLQSQAQHLGFEEELE